MLLRRVAGGADLRRLDRCRRPVPRLRVLRLMLARSVGLIYLALGDGVSHLDRICLVLLV